MSIATGESAPDIRLPATGDQNISFTDFKGRKLVVYFYPKDNTPGCTQEGQDFRDLYPEFEAADVAILGISRDSVRTHQNFKTKHGFPFDLLADTEEVACQAFGVIVQKKLYGREYLGVDRSTWLFDSDGILRQSWRKVRVKGHAQAVLDAAREL